MGEQSVAACSKLSPALLTAFSLAGPAGSTKSPNFRMLLMLVESLTRLLKMVGSRQFGITFLRAAAPKAFEDHGDISPAGDKRIIALTSDGYVAA